MKLYGKEVSGASVAVGVVFALASTPWWGFVAAKLWAWFAVPLGAPPVGLWHMCGVSALVAMFGQKGLARQEWTLPDELSRLLLGPAISLGLGALFRWLAS